MITAVLVTAFTFLVSSVLYYRSMAFLPFMLGLALGSAVSIAKVILVDRAVDKALSMDRSRAGTYVGAQYLLRMLLTAAALIISAVVPWMSIWGAAAGVLAFQIGIYLVQFRSRGRAGSGHQP